MIHRMIPYRTGRQVLIGIKPAQAVGIRAIAPSTLSPMCAHLPDGVFEFARPPDCVYFGFFSIFVASAASMLSTVDPVGATGS